MKLEIKSWLTGGVLFSAETENMRLCIELAVKSGADLSRANLSRANLSDANLYGANLSGANLYGANLYGANLYGANLSGADLSDANLSRANLSGADLYGANLSGANLSGADLYAWAQVGWHSHGECGRTLTAIKHNDDSEAVFFCGCFKGTEKKLRAYIANGKDSLKPSRTLCVDTCVMLLKQPRRE